MPQVIGTGITGCGAVIAESASSTNLRRWVETRDEDAFKRLVESHQTLVVAACRCILRDSADIDDAVQETFFKLSVHAASVRYLASWLHRCATNSALDLHRTRSSRLKRETGAEPRASTAEPFDACTALDIRQTVGSCVARLPAMQRTVLIEYFWHGRTQDAIAQRMGVSQVTIKKRIDRALDDLRRSCIRICC